MTKKFDDKARSFLLENINVSDHEFKDADLNSLEVRELTVKEVRGVISLFHYSRMLKNFKDKIQRYPKCDKADMVSDLDIIAENLGGYHNE